MIDTNTLPSWHVLNNATTEQMQVVMSQTKDAGLGNAYPLDLGFGCMVKALRVTLPSS